MEYLVNKLSDRILRSFYTTDICSELAFRHAHKVSLLIFGLWDIC